VAPPNQPPSGPPAGLVPPGAPGPAAAVRTAMTSRFVVVETVTHVAPGGAPSQWDSRYACPTPDEQPYFRKQPVGTDWAPLDTGWVKKPALLLLANPKPAYQVQPTKDQRAATEALVVEVAWEVSAQFLVVVARVRPGESCRFEPVLPGLARVRCPAGEVRLSVVALPGEGA
jgi:hypothetical protein